MRFAGGEKGLAQIVGEALLVCGAFSIATYWLTYPLFVAPASTFFDPEIGGGLSLFSLGDMYAVLWVMSWGVHALTTDPLSLFSANIFHPAPLALTSTDHMLGHLPVFGSIYLASGNSVLANQANLFFCLSASGASMYALLRTWGCRRLAAFGGGFVFAYFPFRLHILPQAHLLATFYFILAILAFDRLLVTERKRFALGFALCIGLQCLCSFYLAYMTLISVAAYAMAVFYYASGSQQRRQLLFLSFYSLLGALPFLATAIPYVASRSAGTVPSAQAQELLRYLSVRLHRLIFVREEQYYAGIIVTILAGVGFLWGRRVSGRPRWACAGAVAIAASCVAFSLGPAAEHFPFPTPYDVASQVIPGFSAMRGPSRFVLFAMVGLSSLAGLGIDALMRAPFARRRWANAVAVVAIVAIAWDYGWLTRTYAVRPVESAASAPPVYKVLRELPRGVVLELPAGGRDDVFEQLRESLYTYRSTFHWQPLINGRAGYEPAIYPLLMALSRGLPDARATRLLQRLAGLRYLVVHDRKLAQRIADLGEESGLRAIEGFGATSLFEVVEPWEDDLMSKFIEMDESKTVLGTVLRRLAVSEVRVRLHVAQGERIRIESGRAVRARLRLANEGVALPVMTTVDDLSIRVGCRWSDQNGEIVFENRVADRLPFDLQSGDLVDANVACPTPLPPGRYRLEIGLTQGGVWFDGGAYLAVEVV